jgi:hypothetical protein
MSTSQLISVVAAGLLLIGSVAAALLGIESWGTAMVGITAAIGVLGIHPNLPTTGA